MRKVFLDDLPRKGGKLGLIDWSKSTGYEVPFVYDDIYDKFKIIGYNKEKRVLTAEYDEKRRDVYSEEIRNCRIGRLIQKISGDFKKEIDEHIKDDKRDLIITDREYRFKERKPDKKGRVYTTKEKWYRYTCNKCGWTEGWIIESALITQDVGCSCCNGKTIVPEINSIYAKAPWMMKWISEEDAKKYTCGNKIKVKVKCPDCGNIKTNAISDIYKNKSIGCNCGDGFSYGHKYVYSLLRQLNLAFEEEVAFNWCEFYNKYKKMMFWIANQILKDERDIEEVVQDSFIKIIRNLDKIEKINSKKTKSFISIIVKNTAIDVYRKNLSNKVEVELDDNFIFPSDELKEVEIEGLNNIEIAIMKLTEIYKEVFLLKYSHELENNEIAKLLNIKESTVRVRLARGKEKLEFILNKMEGVDNE